MVATRFRFRGGRLSLDFVATYKGRYLSGGGEEQLVHGEDLGRWFQLAGLVSEPPIARPAELVQARQLREAVYRLVRPSTRDQPSQTDIDTVNHWAAHCGLRPVLSANARTASMVAEHLVRACLAAVAADAIDILAGPELAYTRECVHAECSVLFLDASRARQRRWCDMTRCGNRSKAERHRIRNREARAQAR
jgi:predicted RNA-binding Zn ribbon-like protein